MNYYKCSFCNSIDVYTIGKSFLGIELQTAINLDNQHILSCNKCDRYSLISNETCNICKKIWIEIYKIKNIDDVKVINSEVRQCKGCLNDS